MSKTPLPLYVGDISGFAQSLRRQMNDLEHTPSHVEMLNLLAKAGGFRNFQHFKAQQETKPNPVENTPALTEADLKRIKQLIRHFDEAGKLIRWPKKFTLRMLSLWVMWSRIPARSAHSELEINALLQENHHFEDHALLRRELVDRGLLERTADGRQYTRIERQPPIEVVELFRKIRSKLNTSPTH